MIKEEEIAKTIRSLIEIHNNNVIQLDSLLREARALSLEVDLLDGTNTEISHDIDGLTAFKIKVQKISARVRL